LIEGQIERLLQIDAVSFEQVILEFAGFILPRQDRGMTAVIPFKSKNNFGPIPINIELNGLLVRPLHKAGRLG
jgi:hypothetical protein